MKTLLTTLIAICSFTLTCCAQWTAGTAPYVYLTTASNNVGIGTTTPAYQITTAGKSGRVASFGDDQSIYSQVYSAFAGRAYFGYNGNTNNAVFQGISAKGLEFNVNNNTFGLGQAMLITSSGKVGIGTAYPDQMLTVNGQVHSTSVVVTSTVPADYVFDGKYYLRPLADVKTYVDINHHLPDVPAAADFKKDGQNLGEMNMLLLRKVEELTLYLIEKDKAQQEQKKINDQLKAQLAAQQEQITELKKLKR